MKFSENIEYEINFVGKEESEILEMWKEWSGDDQETIEDVYDNIAFCAIHEQGDCPFIAEHRLQNNVIFKCSKLPFTRLY